MSEAPERIVLLGCFVTALAGCSTLLIPSASLSDPVEIFIVDHGRTTSLVIPASRGGLLRYAYGDWNYYALQRTDPFHGAAALLWPTRGALGRASLGGKADLANVQRLLPGAYTVRAVCVERAHVHAFEARMEDLYAEHRATEVENRAYGLSFVHHPRAYTYFWNSNHAVASWLREMGVRTRGPSFRAVWRVSPAHRCA